MLIALRAGFLLFLIVFLILDYNLKLKIKNREFQYERVNLANDRVNKNLKIFDMVVCIVLILCMIFLYIIPNTLGNNLFNGVSYILYIVMLRYAVEYITLKRFLLDRKEK